MHYVIFTIGTRGDVQPYIALALGLIDKGHRVTLAAPENFKDFIEGYGVSFFPLAANAEQIMTGPEGREMVQKGSTMALMRYFYKTLYLLRCPLRKSFLEAASLADVIISNQMCMQYIGPIAEKLNKKYALSYFMPPLLETGEFPAPDMQLINARWYNRLTYRIALWAAWQFLKKEVAEFRQELELPPLKGTLFEDIIARDPLDFYSFSPTLIPRPADWPARSIVTGFLTLPPLKREKHSMDAIPLALKQWLEAGEKPVYIGFGSNGVPDKKNFGRLLKEVLTETEHRIVFCEGWSGVKDLPEHPRLFVVKSANHEWLLPHCKTAVIHGGAGTLAAVLRTGIPVIVASFYTDQPTWGRIVERKKAGVHIPFKKLTAEKLMAAINATQKTEMLKTASELGARIRQEDGVVTAIEAIEGYFNRNTQ